MGEGQSTYSNKSKHRKIEKWFPPASCVTWEIHHTAGVTCSMHHHVHPYLGNMGRVGEELGNSISMGVYSSSHISRQRRPCFRGVAPDSVKPITELRDLATYADRSNQWACLNKLSAELRDETIQSGSAYNFLLCHILRMTMQAR